MPAAILAQVTHLAVRGIVLSEVTRAEQLPPENVLRSIVVAGIVVLHRSITEVPLSVLRQLVLAAQ